MKGGGKTQTTTQTVDPYMDEKRRQVWGAAEGAANRLPPGVDPATLEAMGGYRGMMQAGNLGFGALTGDPAAMSAFMNPYTNQVVDRMRAGWGDASSMVSRGVADRATAAGAWGGSRHGVAEGVAQAELMKGMLDQEAGLLSSGFESAMGRAGAMANLGFGATGALAGLGDYRRGVDLERDPAAHRLRVLSGAMGMMPYGTSTTQPVNRNAGAGFLGGAATGAGIGSTWGPWGTAIGAGIGGLLGLF